MTFHNKILDIQKAKYGGPKTNYRYPKSEYVKSAYHHSDIIYSRTSMARTLMARLPWLFRTRV